MNTVRLAVVGVLVLGLTAAARADEDKGNKSNIQKKLVGKWEVVKVTGKLGSPPPGATYEFTRDGTVIVTVEEAGKKDRFEATYKVAGKRLMLALKQGPDETRTIKVVKVDDNELVLSDEKEEGEVTLKKKAGALDDDAKAKEEAKKLEGTWTALKAELAGQPYPEKAVKKWKLQLSDGKYTVPGDDNQDEHARMKLDPSKNPATMDITWIGGHNSGSTFPAIYELKGDTLRICYDYSGSAHPTEFKTRPKTALFLIEYKRVKP